MFSDSIANLSPFAPTPKQGQSQPANNDDRPDKVEEKVLTEIPLAISEKAFGLLEDTRQWNCLVPSPKSIDDFIARFYERFHQIDKVATKKRYIEGHLRPFHIHSIARLKRGGWISHSTNISLLCHPELVLEENRGIWHFNLREEINHYVPRMTLIMERSYSVDAFDNARSKSELGRHIGHPGFTQHQLIEWISKIPDEADELWRRQLAQASLKLKVKNI